ncbi:MAG: DNA-binding response regulator [Nitrospinota bacterium]|nr:MAG: DNA-binding response regulator [Nitrospinota bacterium]
MVLVRCRVCRLAYSLRVSPFRERVAGSKNRDRYRSKEVVSSIRVLLVDDHTLFRKGLAYLLSLYPDIEVVGEAENGEEAIARAQETQPDVILMDIYMPRMGGLEATQKIKALMPALPIVILTVSDDEQTLLAAIKSGAQGYLLKDIAPEELVEMLRGMARGEAPLSRATAAKILAAFSRQIHQDPPPPTHHLTQREQEVLSLVAQGATNKEIALALHISESTVKNHLQSILEKLHLGNRVQAATYAIQHGLLDPFPSEES